MEREVGLDTKRVEFLCQLGGIESVSIRNNNDRPTPVIVGITYQGAAMAGFTTTDSLAKYQNTNKSKGRPYSASWSSLDISINSDEARIKLDMENKDTKDPNNWAGIIDSSLKDSIASASFQNLVKRRSIHMGFSILINTIPTLFMIRHYLENDILGMTSILFAYQMVNKVSDYAEYGYEKPGTGKRVSLSIYEFPELDRKFILDGVMLFSRLAKGMK